MDTLSTGTKDFGKVSTYFESQDNVKRISKQQTKNICVIIGNPPYNAVQTSFNDANPAEKYPDVDRGIEETYVKQSAVRNKHKQYDMYKRFMKWASERIENNGMVVFVSNNSFLDAKANDGFRRSIYEEFDYIYTINMKGNARTSGDERQRQAGNVFRDTVKVGIAISFFIKTGENKSELYYSEVADCMKSNDKLKWLANSSLSTLSLRKIIPDKDANWLNQTNNDFDNLMPIINDKYSMFNIISLGSTTGKDDWVYDFDINLLRNKMKFFINFYNKTVQQYRYKSHTTIDVKKIKKHIKWSDKLFANLKQKNVIEYSENKILLTMYRPFIIKYQYFEKKILERTRKFSEIFKENNPNKTICFPNPKANSLFNRHYA